VFPSPLASVEEDEAVDRGKDSADEVLEAASASKDADEDATAAQHFSPWFRVFFAFFFDDDDDDDDAAVSAMRFFV